jgi:hypothetical protein
VIEDGESSMFGDTSYRGVGVMEVVFAGFGSNVSI